MAFRVRAAVVDQPEVAPLLDLRPLLRVGGFRLELDDLAADRGGLEAMMVPSPRGGFQIRVDPRPPGGWRDTSPELQRETARHRLRFRVAHEIAHSFFFERRGSELRRRRPSSPAEERFCDEFASALLVPPPAVRSAKPDAKLAVDLHRRYDVSVQVAARALASAHPDLGVAIFYPDPSDELVKQWASGITRPEKSCFFALSKRAGTSVCELPAPRRQAIWVGAAEG